MADIVKVTRNEGGIRELRRDLAYGLHAVGLVAELEAKREAPVRGGYRSFRPGRKPIGGTLRRSIHTATFVDGQQIAVSNDSGKQIPEQPSSGIETFVGTNSGYGAYVELGTRKMAARAFLSPGLETAAGGAATTMAKAIARVRR